MKFWSGNKFLTNWLASLRSGITSGLGLCIRTYRYASQLVRRYYQPDAKAVLRNTSLRFFITARAWEGCMKNQGLVFPGMAQAPS